MIFKRKKKKLENFESIDFIKDTSLPLVPFGEKITYSIVVLIRIDRIASQSLRLLTRYLKPMSIMKMTSLMNSSRTQLKSDEKLLLRILWVSEKWRDLSGWGIKENPRQIISRPYKFQVFFDLNPGSIRIEFIETFCRHTKSPFAGRPFKLTLWEKAFLQVSYGFNFADTKLRRFNKVALLMLKKW